MIAIPDRLRAKAGRVGPGRDWLAELPGMCRRLSAEWSVELGPAFPGCHVSLVLAACRDSRALVLKVPLPATIELGTLPAGARAAEADALRLWDGTGSAELVEHDRVTGAMLVERCVPGTPLDRLDPDSADRVAAGLLRRLHRPVPTDGTFERLAERAGRLAEELPVRFATAGAPFDRSLSDAAVGLLAELSGSGPAEVLLHGDFHHANVLAAEREPWTAIDPLPMIGDPSYDVVQYLLFCKGDLADPASEWDGVIDRFCARLDLDAERVRAWLFARLVSDALASYCDGMSLEELEARQGDLWSARLLRRRRR